MMKIIAAVNNKGGVGKTKISEIISEYLSKYKHKRVLAIDCDPQCNFSHRYLKMDIDPIAPEGTIPPLHPDYDPTEQGSDNWDGRSSIADIFFDQSIIPYPTYIKNLDIAPGRAERLLAAEAVRKAEVAEKIHRRLREFLYGADICEAYDVVVIDTAPSKGPLTVSVIKSATDIVIPSVMEAQPIQGVYGMLQLWMQESLSRNNDNKLNLVGILPNMFKHTTLHEDMLNSLMENKSIGKYVLPVKLGHRISFAEVDTEGASPRSIFDLPDSTAAKQEALEVCECITKRIFSHE